jgi:hypothetical protein
MKKTMKTGIVLLAAIMAGIAAQAGVTHFDIFAGTQAIRVGAVV